MGQHDCSYTLFTSALNGVNCQRHTPVTLYLPRKGPRYPLDERQGGSQSRSECKCLKKSLAPHPDGTPVAYLAVGPSPKLTELHRFKVKKKHMGPSAHSASRAQPYAGKPRRLASSRQVSVGS